MFGRPEIQVVERVTKRVLLGRAQMRGHRIVLYMLRRDFVEHDTRHRLLYENCRHGLDDCRDEIDRDLLAWIRKVVEGPAADDETAA